jgi:hypothetical protein
VDRADFDARRPCRALGQALSCILQLLRIHFDSTDSKKPLTKSEAFAVIALQKVYFCYVE